MTKIQKPLHSTFYILHSFIIVAFILALSSSIAFAKETPPVADGNGAATEKTESAKKPAPSVIPCPKNLPCIQPATQAKGASAIREHVIGKWAATFLTGFLGLAAATAVIFIIVGGLQMHLAFGNDEAVGTAKKTLTWAVVGLVIAILSVAIVRIISSISL